MDFKLNKQQKRSLCLRAKEVLVDGSVNIGLCYSFTKAFNDLEFGFIDSGIEALALLFYMGFEEPKDAGVVHWWPCNEYYKLQRALEINNVLIKIIDSNE